MGPHDQETVSLTHAASTGVGDVTAASSGPGMAGTVGMTGGVTGRRELTIPRQLGGVRLIREIGRGGMGVVWVGHDEMLGRDVAVKFLLGAASSGDDPSFAAFLEGARAAAKLKLPGITAVYHADVVAPEGNNGDRAPYIVMEYVDGPTLTQVVHRTGPLHVSAAWAVMRSICETVAGLHEAGIIHRDIKPSNVMLDTDCNIYLTDFGVALLRPDSVGGEARMTRANMAGTPAYMAPEMFDGYASARSDTYQLGMMFYELLSGAVAFDGTSLEALREAQRSREPSMAVLVERKIERGVIDVIERALRKDPKFRYKSARHMLEAMDRAQIASGVRLRATAELRSAALKARTSGGGAAGGYGVSEAKVADATPQRSLYDHMATMAANKRANPQSPPVKSRDASSLYSSALNDQPPDLLAGGVVPERPGGGGGERLEYDEKPDDAPLKPVAILWIGIVVFVVLLAAIAFWWLAGIGRR